MPGEGNPPPLCNGAEFGGRPGPVFEPRAGTGAAGQRGRKSLALVPPVQTGSALYFTVKDAPAWDLKPETAWGGDVGYEQQLGKSGIWGVNFFYRDVKDLIEIYNTGAPVDAAVFQRMVIKNAEIKSSVQPSRAL